MARFINLQQNVSLYAFDVQGSSTLVTMEAISLSGGVLTRSSVKTGAGWVQLSVSRPQADIAFIHVSGPPSQGCVYLDDLTFGSGTISGSAGADFALYFYGLDIGTQPGQSGRGAVVLNRFGNSNGRIAFTVSGGRRRRR